MPLEPNIKKKVLHHTKIMGILNITPDSFYDGGRYNSVNASMLQVQKMVKDGVDIIDIGGMSSRPGAEIINSEEELTRIEPTIVEIRNQFPNIPISIDTIHSNTALKCLKHDIQYINDISGGEYDSNMYEVLKDAQIPYILMHMQNQPKDMQQNPKYEDVATDILQYFERKLEVLHSFGLSKIVLDPGFGFGKTIEDNYKILSNIDKFKINNLNILAGISRKSMIYKFLDKTPESILPETSALHWHLLNKNVDILRVHDVKELFNIRKMYLLMEKNK